MGNGRFSVVVRGDKDVVTQTAAALNEIAIDLPTVVVVAPFGFAEKNNPPRDKVLR